MGFSWRSRRDLKILWLHRPRQTAQRSLAVSQERRSGAPSQSRRGTKTSWNDVLLRDAWELSESGLILCCTVPSRLIISLNGAENTIEYSVTLVRLIGPWVFISTSCLKMGVPSQQPPRHCLDISLLNPFLTDQEEICSHSAVQL